MDQPIRFLMIRAWQVIREFKSLGVFYSLVLLLSFILLLYFTYVSITSFKTVLIGSAVLFIILGGIHINRSDRTFINCNAEKPWMVYFLEYAAISSLFIFIFIFRTNSLIPVLLFIPVLFLSLVTYQNNTAFFESVSLKFIDTENYEWLSGIRRTGWFIFILVASALVLSPIAFAPMILLWLVLIVASTFYEQHESLEMLESFDRSASKLLIYKLKVHLKLVGVPFAIIMIIATLFHPEKWWVYLLFMFYSVVMLFVFIVTKYSVWGTPGNHKAGNVTNALCLIGFFIPFLLPLPLIIMVLNYKRSIYKLEPVLNDYN